MNNDLLSSEEVQKPNPIIKPMSLGISLLFFGVPALVFFFGFSRCNARPD
jgi:hypothetical protein